MSICTLKAHLYSLDQNPNFAHFRLLNLQSKFSYVPYGCKYSPQALFFVIFGFFEQNRIFFIPWSPLSDKNSLSSVYRKESSFSPSLNKIPISGLLSQNVLTNWLGQLTQLLSSPTELEWSHTLNPKYSNFRSLFWTEVSGLPFRDCHWTKIYVSTK